MFRTKTLRLRWTGSSRAGADAVMNTGDVFEAPEPAARAWIAAGHAEETSAPIGPSATDPGRPCWRCGAFGQYVSPDKCSCCKAPQ
jgi:hypothetical protein